MNARISDAYFDTFRAFLRSKRRLLDATTVLERAIWREHARSSDVDAIELCIYTLNSRVKAMAVALSERERAKVDAWCRQAADVVRLVKHQTSVHNTLTQRSYVDVENFMNSTSVMQMLDGINFTYG